MSKTAIGLIIFLLLHSPARAQLVWVWQDEFSSREKSHLMAWVRHAMTGVENLFGALPYTIEIHFYRKSTGNGPVPWANTDKRGTPSAHFHVNMRYAPEAFKKDWTAPHELSHLLFPYLGRDGMWFAEGIASYLQYQIMYASGVKTWRQLTDKLHERFKAARRYQQFDDLTLLQLNDIVFQTGAFVRLYWAGAAYFLHADRLLYEQKGMRLNDVIVNYLSCCIDNHINSADGMLRLFDKISNSDIFLHTYQTLVLRAGFPAVQPNLDWYKRHPPELRSQGAAKNMRATVR